MSIRLLEMIMPYFSNIGLFFAKIGKIDEEYTFNQLEESYLLNHSVKDAIETSLN